MQPLSPKDKKDKKDKSGKGKGKERMSDEELPNHIEPIGDDATLPGIFFGKLSYLKIYLIFTSISSPSEPRSFRSIPSSGSRIPVMSLIEC